VLAVPIVARLLVDEPSDEPAMGVNTRPVLRPPLGVIPVCERPTDADRVEIPSSAAVVPLERSDALGAADVLDNPSEVPASELVVDDSAVLGGHGLIGVNVGGVGVWVVVSGMSVGVDGLAGVCGLVGLEPGACPVGPVDALCPAAHHGWPINIAAARMVLTMAPQAPGILIRLLLP
jgi:hypothetical protein